MSAAFPVSRPSGSWRSRAVAWAEALAVGASALERTKCDVDACGLELQRRGPLTQAAGDPGIRVAKDERRMTSPSMEYDLIETADIVHDQHGRHSVPRSSTALLRASRPCSRGSRAHSPGSRAQDEFGSRRNRPYTLALGAHSCDHAARDPGGALHDRCPWRPRSVGGMGRGRDARWTHRGNTRLRW